MARREGEGHCHVMRLCLGRIEGRIRSWLASKIITIGIDLTSAEYAECSLRSLLVTQQGYTARYRAIKRRTMLLAVPPGWHGELLALSSPVQPSRTPTTYINTSFVRMSQNQEKEKTHGKSHSCTALWPRFFGGARRILKFH